MDKHVGLTDEQLTQRLRDQPNAPSASAFKDLATAQRLTQQVLDNDANAIRVDEWIQGVERRMAARPNYNPDASSIQPPLQLTVNEVVGRTVTRDQYDAHGMNATAQDVHTVQVALKYKRGLDPPFVVVTAYPVSP
ncbi:hypothetical protein HCJ93_25980 [Streptomyces sp. SBST2-5]|uniref:Bacterial CdiA-CT RNAse A domain-containing protein n=1 Tax=Streptomyces composti TaxID=2720025 RepID=A0ABX1AA92_9ACTN|nr:hypothetical protein [Streptomyces composti]